VDILFELLLEDGDSLEIKVNDASVFNETVPAGKESLTKLHYRETGEEPTPT